VLPLKYSGVRSLHLMIPLEAFPRSFGGKSILSYFRRHCGVKKIDQPTVLRLAYMLNEDKGLVNLPITPEELPLFRPWEVHLHNVTNVTIDQPWHGNVPTDASKKTLRLHNRDRRGCQSFRNR